MKLYKVIFHFGKEDMKTLHVEGNNAEEVLLNIYGGGDFYIGTQQGRKGIYRINLKQVNYITVLEKLLEASSNGCFFCANGSFLGGGGLCGS